MCQLRLVRYDDDVGAHDDDVCANAGANASADACSANHDDDDRDDDDCCANDDDDSCADHHYACDNDHHRCTNHNDGCADDDSEFGHDDDGAGTASVDDGCRQHCVGRDDDDWCVDDSASEQHSCAWYVGHRTVDY